MGKAFGHREARREPDERVSGGVHDTRAVWPTDGAG